MKEVFVMGGAVLKFLGIAALGTLGHFIYEWTGENRVIGWFFPVNESIFEHLKLIFFPAIIYSVAEHFIKKKPCTNCLPSLLSALVCGMLSIIVSFYTYTGVFGVKIDFLNILIFFLAVAVFVSKYNKKVNSGEYSSKKANLISLILLVLIAFLFGYFTENPLSIPLFIPPR